jgi:hypothetical protein
MGHATTTETRAGSPIRPHPLLRSPHLFTRPAAVRHAGHGCQTRARIAAAAIVRELAVLSRRCRAPARITRYPLRCQSAFLAPHGAPAFPHESAVNDVFSMREPKDPPQSVVLLYSWGRSWSARRNQTPPRRCDEYYSRSATFLPLKSAAPPGHGHQRGRR